MAILVDTQALVWLATGERDLSPAAYDAVTSGSAEIWVSAVTAFEFVDLNLRGRFGMDIPLQRLLDRFEGAVVDYPAGASALVDRLPALHRDPVDRMLIAHAIHADVPLVTADATIRRYPVRTIW